MKPPAKSYIRTGKWTPKKTISEILVCECGGRYIKTRKDQIFCVRCIYKRLKP